MSRLLAQISKVIGRNAVAAAPEPEPDYARAEFVDSGFLANDEHRHSWSLDATCSAFAGRLPGQLPTQTQEPVADKSKRGATAVVSKRAWPAAR
jgi:hypothetical protein